jgi:hypothetical protein
VAALDCRKIRHPARSAECRIVEDSRVKVDQALADAIAYVIEITQAKLIDGETGASTSARDENGT